MGSFLQDRGISNRNDRGAAQALENANEISEGIASEYLTSRTYSRSPNYRFRTVLPVLELVLKATTAKTCLIADLLPGNGNTDSKMINSTGGESPKSKQEEQGNAWRIGQEPGW